ncbi:hypothetical protein Lalb_Chr06g0171941 [Lupinus albus]|uniref:Uncharacterized protein n=1 Tax=Lupinus albus TaxID=3870 RepID=A0A6A4QEH0_LUPAL|nr:hypothetical protein Lalb_Chr06g0171941 [Lupinus albus]
MRLLMMVAVGPAVACGNAWAVKVVVGEAVVIGEAAVATVQSFSDIDVVVLNDVVNDIGIVLDDASFVDNMEPKIYEIIVELMNNKVERVKNNSVGMVDNSVVVVVVVLGEVVLFAIVEKKDNEVCGCGVWW